MAERGQENPEQRTRLPVQNRDGGKEQKRRRKIARVQMLVGDEDRCAGDGHGQERGDERDAGPLRHRLAKTFPNQLQAPEQNEKNARDMQKENEPFERKVRDAGSDGDYAMK